MDVFFCVLFFGVFLVTFVLGAAGCNVFCVLPLYVRATVRCRHWMRNGLSWLQARGNFLLHSMVYNWKWYIMSVLWHSLDIF